MHGPDVFGQVGAAGEQEQAVVPAAGVAAQALGAPRHRARGGPWTADQAPAASAVHHGRSGAPAGRRALHVHQGAADAGGGQCIAPRPKTKTWKREERLCVKDAGP